MWLSFLLRALLQLFLMLTVYLNVLWSDFILYTFSIVHSAPTTLASLMFFELPRKGTLRDYVLSVSAAWACSLPASRAQSLYPLTLSQITPLEFTPSLFTLLFFIFGPYRHRITCVCFHCPISLTQWGKLCEIKHCLVLCYISALSRYSKIMYLII